VDEAVEFAAAAGALRLVLFHHDPAHDDATLDRLTAAATAQARRLGGRMTITGGHEGDEYEVVCAPVPSAGGSAGAS
jgi:hypothetical protein